MSASWNEKQVQHHLPHPERQQGRAQASWKHFSTATESRQVKIESRGVAYLTQDQRSASLPASRLHRMSVPVIADIVSPENFKNYGKNLQNETMKRNSDDLKILPCVLLSPKIQTKRRGEKQEPFVSIYCIPSKKEVLYVI
jgi:hypothetical protein